MFLGLRYRKKGIEGVKGIKRIVGIEGINGIEGIIKKLSVIFLLVTRNTKLATYINNEKTIIGYFICVTNTPWCCSAGRSELCSNKDSF